MSETQGYKISYQTKEAALFALRSRVHQIENLPTSTDRLGADYWALELEKAKAAIAELEAL